MSVTRATVLIEDDGRGFPEGFVLAGRERFTPDGVVGGAGLSLCLASDVAIAHGGGLFGGASTLPPQRAGVSGAAVSVELPVRGSGITAAP
ncbi:MAG: hypothetical protein IPI67_38835 [Myxococcales bacterium]|nr:hypothetical protein [Myxococcales bacterium]